MELLFSCLSTVSWGRVKYADVAGTGTRIEGWIGKKRTIPPLYGYCGSPGFYSGLVDYRQKLFRLCIGAGASQLYLTNDRTSSVIRT